jgi:hypothetical protein
MQSSVASPCDPNNPNICAVPLMLHQPAPFAGQLLTTELAVLLSQTAAGCEDRIKLEVERTKDDASVDLQKQQTDCQAQSDSFTAELAKANAAAARAQKLAEEEAPPWYAQPWFVGPAAAIVSAGVVVSIVVHK